MQFPGARPTLLSFSCPLNKIGTWQRELETDIFRVDDLVAEMYGLDPDRLDAGYTSRDIISGVHPDDREYVRRHVARALSVPGPYVAEYRTRARDGSIRHVAALGRCYHDPAGRPVRVTGVSIDLTEQDRGLTPYVAVAPPAADHPLERAADLCIAARQAIGETHQPFLLKLADMLLMELGRVLGRRARAERRRLC